MIYTTTTPADLQATIRAARRMIQDYAPDLPKPDDAEIAAAIGAALRQWDAADPLILYYRPGRPAVRIPPFWTPTDCYAGDPDPDRATPWTQADTTITSPLHPDPVWRILWAREIHPAPAIKPAAWNTTQPVIDAYTYPTLSLDSLEHIANPDPSAIAAYLPIGEQPAPRHGAYRIKAPLTLWEALPAPAWTPIHHPTAGILWSDIPAPHPDRAPHWSPAPPSRTNVSEHDAINLIAPRAAAWIILARCPSSHPAHDWARATMDQPFPKSQDVIAHSIQPRRDYIRDDWTAPRARRWTSH